MSRENANAKIIRRFAEAFNARDEAGLSTRFACVATYAGGKAVEATLYRHLGDALEAVGLRE